MRMFGAQLHVMVKAYIDDMVVKSRREEDHLADLADVFAVLKKHKLLLNAEKCAFGVSSRKFLGYLVTRRGIEADPSQIAATQNLRPPTRIKEVQQLTRMVVALNRFISKSSDMCQPFFGTL